MNRRPSFTARLIVGCCLLATFATAAVTPNATLTADQAAARFLIQATFGPTTASIAELRNLNNDYGAWIDAEAAKAPTYSRPIIEALRVPGGALDPATFEFISGEARRARNEVMMSGSDQLRQRVAYALSQILVISDVENVIADARTGTNSYYDMLLSNALGNYRTLLTDVTLHPMMGRYLSHRQNRKADAAAGTRPDENYAREVMQLFTIGLFNLNANGTPILVNNAPVESYTNANITEFARVFTGLTDAGTTTSNNSNFPGGTNFVDPMRMFQTQHDVGAKTLLNYPGVRTATRDLAANRPGMDDINSALDNLFEHPNTPPFVCRQLIQRLVTSNPSNAYVGRVAAVFVNNGSGVRGDLKAVVKAILLDSEARDAANITQPGYGKLKEPFLRVTAVLRAMNYSIVNVTSQNFLLHNFNNAVTQTQLGQYPMSSPSVFNFYSPDYQPAGPIDNAGLVAPEFQILNSVFGVATPNVFWNLLYGSTNNLGNFRISLTSAAATASTNPTALVDQINLLLCGGTMSAETRTGIINAVTSVTDSMSGVGTGNAPLQRARLAYYLAILSPDFAIQK